MTEVQKRGPGFVSKVGGYLGRRVMPTASQDMAKKFGMNSMRGAAEAIKPKKYDAEEFAAGHAGRYVDRGVARFGELMRENKLSESDLAHLMKRHSLLSIVYGVIAVILMLNSLYCIAVGTGAFDFFVALASFCVFLALSALAMRHDYASWQVKLRAFPGFRAYLNERW